jgi:hypothetical protein
MRTVEAAEVDPLPGDDAVDDPKLAFGVANSWVDIGIGSPMLGDANVTTGGFKWSVRLARDPVPHWLLRISMDNTTTVDDPADPFNWGVLIHLVGSGTGSHVGSAGILKEVGSTYEHGHYSLKMNWHEDGNVESGDAINGTLAEINRPKHVVIAESATAGGNTGTLYFRTPNALVGDAAHFTSDDPPMVTVFCHNTIATPTLATETGWLATTLGGNRPGTYDTMNDPPVHSLNDDVWAHYSSLDWQSGSSQWAIRTFNKADTGNTRNFYMFALGR